jgi:hypothetical protein
VDRVDVINPYYDYVRPELVDAYITNEWVFIGFCLHSFWQFSQWRSSSVLHIPVRSLENGFNEASWWPF